MRSGHMYAEVLSTLSLLHVVSPWEFGNCAGWGCVEGFYHCLVCHILVYHIYHIVASHLRRVLSFHTGLCRLGVCWWVLPLLSLSYLSLSYLSYLSIQDCAGWECVDGFYHCLDGRKCIPGVYVYHIFTYRTVQAGSVLMGFTTAWMGGNVFLVY